MADLTPLVSALSLRKLCGKDTVTYHGVYAGDLLSRAMSHVKAGSLWITIMNNMNVIAVASLTEAAAVLLAEGVSLPIEVQKAAEAAPRRSAMSRTALRESGTISTVYSLSETYISRSSIS